MKHSELILHLDNEGCFPDGDGVFETGTLYKNCINAQVCLVPNVEEVNVPTCCHIFFELKIAAPFDLESDYEIYKMWRKAHEAGKAHEAQSILKNGGKPE